MEELTARAALREADEPHTILVCDPALTSAYAIGVYPNAFAAVQASENVRQEANQETDAETVEVLIIPIYGATDDDP